MTKRANQLCLLYDDIENIWSYTLFEVTDYWVHRTKSCNWAQRCRLMIYLRHVSTKYNPEHYLQIPNEADTCQSYNAEYDSESISGIQSYEITKLDGICCRRSNDFQKEGNDCSGIKNNSNANNHPTGCAGTKYCEADWPIKRASSDNRTTRKIYKLDSINCHQYTQTGHGQHT